MSLKTICQGQRGASKEMQTWNKDPDNPRVIRVQNKGSRFVVDWKSRYKSKTMEYLQDKNAFRQPRKTQVNSFMKRWKDG